MLDTSTFINGTHHAVERTMHAAHQPLALRTLIPGYAEAANAFFRRRGLMKARIGARNATFAAEWNAAPHAIKDPWTVTLTFGDGAVELVLPSVVLNIVIADLEPELIFDALGSAQRTIILEYALSGTLEAMEAALRKSISVLAVDKKAAPENQDVLMMSLQLDGLEEMPAVLRGDMTSLLMLAEGMDRLAGPARQKTPVSLTVPAFLRHASVELSLYDVKQLNAGDIVFFDAHCQPQAAVLVIGDTLAARVDIAPDGRITLRDTLRPLHQADLAAYSDELPICDGPLGDCAPAGVRVRLFAEWPSLLLDLADLPTLAADKELSSATKAQPDLRLVVGGVPIATGKLTTVGTATGLQITRKF